jgi:hypothetical protein
MMDDYYSMAADFYKAYLRAGRPNPDETARRLAEISYSTVQIMKDGKWRDWNEIVFELKKRGITASLLDMDITTHYQIIHWCNLVSEITDRGEILKIKDSVVK